jgi:hypothetical protein
MDDKEKQKLLKKAKRVREKLLEEHARLLNACNCMYPIRKLRNGSGHSDDCPAHALWKADDDVLSAED